MDYKKYVQAFVDAFVVTEEEAPKMRYKDGTWDSIGHMFLIAELEKFFGIEFALDDVVKFDSFEKGLELLRKYV